MNTLLQGIAVGCVATLVMDAWGLLRQRLLGQALPNYAQVGRWLGHSRQPYATTLGRANAKPAHARRIRVRALPRRTGVAPGATVTAPQ